MPRPSGAISTIGRIGTEAIQQCHLSCVRVHGSCVQTSVTFWFIFRFVQRAGKAMKICTKIAPKVLSGFIGDYTQMNASSGADEIIGDGDASKNVYPQQRHTMQYNCITQEMIDNVELLHELVIELQRENQSDSKNYWQNGNTFTATQDNNGSPSDLKRGTNATDTRQLVKKHCRYGRNAYVNYQAQAYEYMLRKTQTQQQRQEQMVQSIRHFRDAVLQTLENSVEDAYICLCNNADFCNFPYQSGV